MTALRVFDINQLGAVSVNNPFTNIRNFFKQHKLLIPLDVLIVGATGVGRSSTINAIFGKEHAVVGTGVDPMTQRIKSFKKGKYLRFRDSAGLGDSPLNDVAHSLKIIKILNKTTTVNSEPTKYKIIDLVLIILDCISRDIGTVISLLEKVIMPNIDHKRVIIALNQADMAMKGRNWDDSNNCPNPTLYQFLDAQALTVQQRISKAIKKEVNVPIYYSAYKNFNIDALINSIFENIPIQRRIS